ncbi:MAG TPA: class I SAM-dependent methyltransferase [Propionibacteriaceae bacterium]|nr:class I SAM-dependent methyltransferase [Propionibacteriaceae bacterium]
MAELDQPAAWTWDEETSRHWLAEVNAREALLVPVLEALMEAAELSTGERVLDVGCGAGTTTLAAAVRVGPQGVVTGVDISPAMIAAARERAADEQVDWLVADAEQHRFPAGSYDAVISRFGVMFFADPLRAFRNLAAACREGGRLVVVVWPLRDRSDFFTRPLQVLVGTGQRLGRALPLPPVNRGPFSLGDPERLHRLLSDAGWRDITIDLDQRKLYLGGPGASVEQAVDFVLDLGPAQMALGEQPAELVDTARSDLARALLGWKDDVGFGLPGGFLVVSARR